MHRLLSELAGQGLGILMISSELPEVLGMADRVLVVCEGRITAELARDEATPESVMRAATASPTHRRVASGPTTTEEVSPHEPTRMLVAASRVLAGPPARLADAR